MWWMDAAHGGDDDTMSDVSFQFAANIAFWNCETAYVILTDTRRNNICSFMKLLYGSPSLIKLICQNLFLLADRYTSIQTLCSTECPLTQPPIDTFSHSIFGFDIGKRIWNVKIFPILKWKREWDGMEKSWIFYIDVIMCQEDCVCVCVGCGYACANYCYKLNDTVWLVCQLPVDGHKLN